MYCMLNCSVLFATHTCCVYYLSSKTGAIGHFTQVIWAETTHIGCGRTFSMSKNNFYSVYIYCNYGPSGNIVTKPVYKRGKPCSNCVKLKCNSKYSGLCGDVKGDDNWVTPFSTYCSIYLQTFDRINKLCSVFRNSWVEIENKHLYDCSFHYYTTVYVMNNLF